MFADLDITLKEASAREIADGRERNQRAFMLWACFALARKLNGMDNFGDMRTFMREKDAENQFSTITEHMEVGALPQAVVKELKAKDLVWTYFDQPHLHATQGMVCELARSEFEYLKGLGAVRRATEEEAWARVAMDEDVKVPGKSLTRSRTIRNACQALRPVVNK